VVGARKAILAIVDDDPGVLESLEKLMESAGYEARGYSSAAALLQSGAVSDIDCVISDIGMPEMDGIELQSRLAHDRPELPVILITARADAAGHKSELKAKTYGFFQKPVDPFALLKAVSDALTASA
jgi:FixJ family two-component response regulator